MNRRTFSASELAKIFSYLPDGEAEIDFGNGVKAVRMASKEKIIFTITGRGADHFLSDAGPDELVELSAFAWEKGKEFIPDDPADVLMPDELKDKPEDDRLMPDELREKPDPLAGTLGALIPDSLRTPADDPNDLTPDDLK